MCRRRFPSGILFVVLFVLLLPNDWTLFPPVRCGYSGKCHTLLFADAASVTTRPHDGVEDEKTSSSPVSSQQARIKEKLTFSQIVARAGKKGLGGGLPGAIAGVVQVLTLMGLRTVINYQMRYGTTFSKAIDVLYRVSSIYFNYFALFINLLALSLLNIRKVVSHDFTEGLGLR